MNLQRGLIIILLTGLLVSSLLFNNSELLTRTYLPGLNNQNQRDESIDESPEYEVSDFNSRNFNQNGQLESSVTAQHLSAYQGDAGLILTKPDIQLFNESGEASWNIQANKASSRPPNTDILLTDSVIMTQLSTPGQKQESTILTEQMWLYTEEKRARSDTQVIILSEKNQIRGVGFQGELATNEFIMESNVQSQYQSDSRQNGEQLTRIHSDSLVIEKNRESASYRGAVRLEHDNIVIHADRIDIIRNNNEETAYAYGQPADFKQQSKTDNSLIHAQALRFEYNTETRKLHMYDQASMKQDGAVVAGDYLYYDTLNELIGAESKPEGRVKMVLPSDKNQ